MLKTKTAPCLTLVLIALSSTACVQTEFDDISALPEAAPRATTVDTRGELGPLGPAACPNERQIVRVQEEDFCPSVDHWTATSLFEAGTPWLLANGSTLSDAGGHWCRYRWAEDGKPNDGDLASLGDNADAVSMGPDCEVVNPQRDSATDAIIAPALLEVFHDQIGRVDADQLQDSSGASTDAQRVPAVVAVIDTMPREQPHRPRSEHGEAMARIITDIACPDDPGALDPDRCRGRVRRVLGLPRIASGVDGVRGGFVGSQGDLAAAIVEAVREWDKEYAAVEPKPPLIINLSVGWDAEEFGGNSANMPTAAAAVRRAIQFASCRGALIIAAAGNKGPLCHDEPLAPATWEQLPAPGVGKCDDLGVTITPPEPGYRPLVHAVGGLAHDDKLMPGSRFAAQPRLMATASHAVAGDTIMTAGLTGTSVAAAVATGAAALVWSYNPSLTPPEVMQLVYEGGLELPSHANFGLGSAAHSTRRKVNVCSALSAACSATGTCPSFSLGCQEPAAVDLSAAIDLVVAAQPPAIPTQFGDPITCAATCDDADDFTLYEATAGSNSCPGEEPVADYAYVAPQPTSPGCNNCTLQGDKVQASLDDTHEHRTVEQVVVILSDQGTETRFDFGAVPLDTHTITGLQLDEDRMPASYDSARISISFGNMYRPIEDELIWR